MIGEKLIKKPWLLVVSIILAFVILYFIVDRIEFITNAEKTIGRVQSISVRNDRCGGRRNRYECTEFSALIGFTTKAGKYGQFNIRAGSARGHNQPISRANLQTSDYVNVIYDPRDITRVYEDSFYGVWGTPIMIFFFQISTLFGAMSRPKDKASH